MNIKFFRTDRGVTFLIALALIAVFGLTGCGDDAPKGQPFDSRPAFVRGEGFSQTTNALSQFELEKYLGVERVARNVYYFPYRAKQFELALSHFTTQSKDLDVISVTGDSEGDKYAKGGSSNVSRHAGYYVVVAQRK